MPCFFTDSKDLPLIQSYDSIQALTQKLGKPEREHDLVVASYVLGEIPSLRDRITVVRQLWDLTRVVLVCFVSPTESCFIVRFPFLMLCSASFNGMMI
ncbi:hypothetical protein MRB53_014129 [Persea americana]|uniref:Uncharacterized protein n=1 Tax=Persea americana TaxID=3435 RepID=A0ACC2KA52_PERAE|nr:hypothetical protein MRB53_014129 [Persea americana]